MARGSRRSRQSRTSITWTILSLMMVAALIIGLVATLAPTGGSQEPQPATPPTFAPPSPIVITVAPNPTQSSTSTATPTAGATPPGIPLPPTQPAP